MQLLEAHIQTVTLIVLALTAIIALWQSIEATRQAKASEGMAKLSLEQTELMRRQMLASFRPILTVTGGEWGTRSASLTVQNIGTGPAVAISAIYLSGSKRSVACLSPEQATKFVYEFDTGNSGRFPLRFEYQSIVGAMCWTSVTFKLSTSGPIDTDEISHGTE